MSILVTSSAAKAAGSKTCPIPLCKIDLKPVHAVGLFGAIAVGSVFFRAWWKQSDAASTIAGTTLESLKKEMKGKGVVEGSIEDFGLLVPRICDIFLKLDNDKNNSVDVSELQALHISKPEAKFLMKNVDADANGSISCDEIVSYFLHLKKSYGFQKVLDLITSFEIELGIDGANRIGGAMKNVLNEKNAHLPALWIPVMNMRVSSIFRRIDTNRNNTLEKSELLALQGGDQAMADLMIKDMHGLDTDKDGVITAHEFLAYFVNILKNEKNDDEHSTKARKKVNKILAGLESQLNKKV